MEEHEALLSAGAEPTPLLHELGDVLEVGMLVLDGDLAVRGFNHWLEAASGRDAAGLVGRSVFDAFPELVGGHAEAAMRRALGGMTTVLSHRFHKYVLSLRPPAGYERFEQMQQSVRVVPLSREGGAAGVLVLVQDVTERVAREEELRDAIEQAEVASRAKSEFLAAISHELRTPLTAVIGYMDLLEGEMVGPVAPLQKTYLGRVKNAARHLLSIIEEILSFSRVEAGKEPLHPERVDAAELARGIEVLFVPQAMEKGIALSTVIPDRPVPLRTDATKLRQILLNLIGNALKFTDAGRVTLELRETDAHVLFRVVDSGLGIAPEDLERIFEPFTQVDRTWNRPRGGTGLGLPVSRRLARLLGGELTVASAVGEGTTFTLSVPMGE